MPLLGQHMPEHAKKLIGLAQKERIEAGILPGTRLHGWSNTEEDQKAMENWKV